MIYVKVCGMTRTEDALAAAAAGAQAVGFVFHVASPRAVTANRAREIGDRLPMAVHRIGVFVDESVGNIEATARDARLTHVQLHGSESVAFARSLSLPVIKAIRIREERDLSQIDEFAPHVYGLLVDAWATDRPGGTGLTCDWTLAARAASHHRILLAGGLGSANVGEAIRSVRPWGVDASSALEVTPGIKDSARLRDFLGRVREIEIALGAQPVLER